MYNSDTKITTKVKNFARRTWDKVNCLQMDEECYADNVGYNPDSNNQPTYKPMTSVLGSSHTSKFSRVSTNRNTTASHYRASVAVIECPIASLMGDVRHDSKEDCIDKTVSMSGPYGNNVASISAFEVMPASPIKDELIEIYVLTEYVIKGAKSINTLIKFMEEVENKNCFILVACNDTIDSALLQKLRVTAVYSPNMFEQYDTKNIVINVIGLNSDGDYLRNAIDMVATVKSKFDGDHDHAKSITIALADCSTLHCKNLVEDINDIHVIIPTGNHKTSKIMSPKGVPIICIDKDSVGHITIGFDDYNQYDIRRTENIKYYDYLSELGLLDFMEEDEDEEW